MGDSLAGVPQLTETARQSLSSQARQPFIRSRSIPLLALAALWGTFGCGSNKTTFSAAEFVATANKHGARLKLGDMLPAGSPDPHYEIEVQTRQPDPEGHPDDETADEHGAHGEEGAHGTLRVTEEASAAEEEHARCERVMEILCFRAANIVLYFEEEHTDPAALAPLDAALRSMAKE